MGYSGQITALLGHNGAGKTTTIGMLTGALAPTSGTAIVAGKDVKSQLSEIREDIGICLQHDCLFPLLTVKEHIQFFSRVKGLYQNKSKSEAEDMIDQAMRDVALHEKRNTQSRKLSGGMKRKLSVAIAFCGGSKVVLLDEPTSGMDPFSRRFTWNVIRQYRQDRCIILTTHFMDEADILGDRIAIMAEGQLRCCGSSLFLKNHYGVGYQLTIERNHEDSDDGRKKKLKEIVTGNVEGAVLLSDVGTELSFRLPVGAASQFTPMFEGLDKEIDEGVVSTYGVSITTLDEVFLLVARGGSAEKKEAYKSSTRISGTATVEADEAEKSARSRMDLEKSNLFNTHVGSMFRKRAAFFRRDKKAWCCTTILPSLFVLFGFVIFRISEGDETYGALKLSLDDFNEDIKEGPRNPVIFNEANSSYTCWSGECAYTPVIESSVTNEKYMYNGVLTIQRLVGDYIIAKTGAANDGFGVAEAGVRYVHFPTAEYEEQGFFSEIGGYGPILICLGLMYPAASIIGFITREKELRQKELMKMMSITEAEIGWSWFTSFFLLHLINVILCTVVSGVLYESTENLFLFMYWLFTFLSVINFCSALATIFSKATTGVLVGLLLFFIGVFLPTFYDYQDGEAGLISLISLRPIAAFAYGMQEIGDLEDKGVGVTSNTWDTSDHPSGYTFQDTLTFLIRNVIFWGVLGGYLTRVIKPAYGQALPFYFPFMSSYWCPGASKHEEVGDEEIEYDDDIPVEPVGESLRRQAREGKSIEIRNLEKTFGEKRAVDDLNLSMYSGQITALLGHNGAGKTTTIGMLTGALAPTSGTPIVAGKDVKSQLSEIREDIGICL